MQRASKLLLFRLTPDPPKPDGREEGEIQDGHDEQPDHVDGEGNGAVQRSGDGPENHDEDESRVPDADGTQARHLHRGPSPRREPEGHDRFEDAERPHTDDRDEVERLKRGVRAFGVRGQLQCDAGQSDGHDARRDEAARPGAQRNEGVAEHEEAVARNEEQDDGQVGQRLGHRPGAAEGRREQDQDGQGGQGEAQVTVAPVGLAHPAHDRPDREGGEGQLDGELDDQE